MIALVGAQEMENATHTARTTRDALDPTLGLRQRGLYIAAMDAAQEVSSLREEAAQHVALVHGLAIGAAFAAFPTESREVLAHVGSRIAGAILGTGMDLARAQTIITKVMEVIGHVAYVPEE